MKFLLLVYLHEVDDVAKTFARLDQAFDKQMILLISYWLVETHHVLLGFLRIQAFCRIFLLCFGRDVIEQKLLNLVICSLTKLLDASFLLHLKQIDTLDVIF